MLWDLAASRSFLLIAEFLLRLQHNWPHCRSSVHRLGLRRSTYGCGIYRYERELRSYHRSNIVCGWPVLRALHESADIFWGQCSLCSSSTVSLSRSVSSDAGDRAIARCLCGAKHPVSSYSSLNSCSELADDLCRLCLAIIIALPVATPEEFRNKPSFAFGGFTNCTSIVCLATLTILSCMTRICLVNGWPDGFAFTLSFLAPLWTIGK